MILERQPVHCQPWVWPPVSCTSDHISPGEDATSPEPPTDPNLIPIIVDEVPLTNSVIATKMPLPPMTPYS